MNSLSKSDSVYNRKHDPSWTRPARPDRWIEDACEIFADTNRGIPVSVSHRGSRRNPLSTTHVTFGIVKDASAIGVETITLCRLR